MARRKVERTIYLYKHPATGQLVEVHRPGKEPHALTRARKNLMDVLHYEGFQLVDELNEGTDDE